MLLRDKLVDLPIADWKWCLCCLWSQLDMLRE